jgi:glutathione S-transferase
MHPLSSFCMKVLIAFYENDTPHEKAMIDFGDPASVAAFEALWPMKHMPVLRDEARDLTLPESSVIIEYLQRFHPGPTAFVPDDAMAALQTRLADRFSDGFVMQPMQKIVTDNLRPEDGHDAFGVAQARETLRRAYDMLEDRMATRRWAIGDQFTLADCALAPALFYAVKVEPFGERRHLRAFYDRLEARPSFARVLKEAEPYLSMFPG